MSPNNMGRWFSPFSWRWLWFGKCGTNVICYLWFHDWTLSRFWCIWSEQFNFLWDCEKNWPCCRHQQTFPLLALWWKENHWWKGWRQIITLSNPCSNTLELNLKSWTLLWLIPIEFSFTNVTLRFMLIAPTGCSGWIRHQGKSVCAISMEWSGRVRS